MTITFRISNAGLAGDHDKLMYGKTDDGREESVLFNSSSLLSRWYATWKLKRMLYITRPQVIKKTKLRAGGWHEGI